MAPALGAADLVNRSAELGNYVLAIEGDVGSGQVGGDPLHEGRGHVAAELADLLWLPPMGHQVIAEALYGGGIPALGGTEHPGRGG